MLSDYKFNELNSVELPMELTTTTTNTYLLDINKDCLKEIFSSLDLMDLCSIAETCTLFKEIANEIFSKEYARACSSMFSKISTHDIERSLKIFGSLISHFAIHDSSEDISDKEDMPEFTFIIDMVTTYCADTIKKLHLTELEIPEVLAVKCIPLFKKLMHLDLSKVTINGGGKELFASCELLVSLAVFEFNHSADILENIFPILERFSYIREDDYDDEYLLAVFISRHKKLKALTITRYKPAFKTSILQVIGDNCKELTELCTHISLENEEAFTSLQALDHLKELNIELNEARDGVNARIKATKFIKALQPLNSLESLELWGAVEDTEFFPALSQLKNLRQLHLVDFVELKNLNALGDLIQLAELRIRQESRHVKVEFDLVHIIKRLVHLEKLEIDMDTFKLDKQMFSKILYIVTGRPKALIFECKFDFDYVGNQELILLKP